MNFLNQILEFFKNIVLTIFKLLFFSYRRLMFVGKGIPLEDKITDFLEIFKSTRVYLIFNLIAFFIFIALPQGKDVILIVIEDLSIFSFGSLISLLIGLIGWSIISEFGARYKIYVTDNSGLALSDERVNYRQEAQKFVSSFYLLLPTTIVFLSVLIVSFNNIKQWDSHYGWPFAIIVALLILTFAILSKFYLDEDFIEKLRKKGVWFKVEKYELKWINKLYGIYNDHVLMVRKSENFKTKTDYEDQQLKNTYQRFTDILESLPPKKEIIETRAIETFPRDYIIDDELAPVEFNVVEYHPNNYRPDFSNKKKFRWIPKQDGYYRWVYKNNPSFYRTLHKQVHVVATSSLIILLIISTNFLISYEFIGSPGLVCLSFGCWLGMYTGLLYLDSRYRKKFHISVRWLVFLWFFIVSFINKDHPVRKNSCYSVNDTVSCKFCDNRFTLNDHFAKWLVIHMKDTAKSWFINAPEINKTPDTGNMFKQVSDTCYPVFFITAEGGALRTGAFTAMLLAKLQDSLPNFKKNIYAFSSVSGGSVGISFFNAVSYIQPDTTVTTPGYYQTITKDFFKQDQLAPTIGKMFYADILNDFWPWHIDNFDRAIALEKTWEHSYGTIFKSPLDENVFSKDFLSCYQKGIAPAWFINTTEVETGLQCYISNVRTDSFILGDKRDLLLNKMRGGINYSTAVNFSSRFPLFSPSAALYQNDDQIYHYVDGGYVENTGAKTMLEILQSLHKKILNTNIRPYVLQIKFGDSTRFGKTGFLNEISSIVSGIYNTRAGASLTYTELLKKEVDSLGGQFIKIPLKASSTEIPMSWVFSNRSLANLENVINSLLKDPYNDLNKKFPDLKKHKRNT